MANYTILLIDYEPRSIERFREPLVGAGYTVEIATDGISGMEAFHRLNPDMVLVEAMIPKKHGFEVCQELKRTPHGQRTPVIITTGVYKGRKYRTQALHIYGCDEYIEKPIAPAQLLGVVGKFFDADASPSSSRAAESVSDSSKQTSEPPPRRHGDADAMASSFSMPPTVANEDAEGEIMARLDAILPKGGNPPSSLVQPAKVAVAKSDALDPFSQMRAELDAELCALPSELLFEPTQELEPPIAPLHSDQAISATVLEALPFPEFQTPIAPSPTAQPVVVDKPKPKVVPTPEPKRSRNHKKQERQNKARAVPLAAVPTAPPAPTLAPTVEQAATPFDANATLAFIATVRPAASTPTGAATAATVPLASVAPAAFPAPLPAVAEAIPRGTMVESVLEPDSKPRGIPAWVFVAAGLVAIVAAYFVYAQLQRNGTTSPSPTVAAAAPTVIPSPVENESPAVAEPLLATPPPAAATTPPAAATTPPAVQEAPEATAVTPTTSNSASVASKRQPPKKTSARASASAPSSTAATLPVAPPTTSAPAEPAIELPKAAESVTPAPVETDAAAGRAEAVADSAPAAPAPLVPIDQAETMPVPISHRRPVFSDRAKQLGLSGTVVMNVLINERGTVDQVVLVTGVPGADVDGTALATARGWTYRPATKNGAPVKVWKSERVAVTP